MDIVDIFVIHVFYTVFFTVEQQVYLKKEAKIFRVDLAESASQHEQYKVGQTQHQSMLCD